MTDDITEEFTNGGSDENTEDNNGGDMIKEKLREMVVQESEAMDKERIQNDFAKIVNKRLFDFYCNSQDDPEQARNSVLSEMDKHIEDTNKTITENMESLSNEPILVESGLFSMDEIKEDLKNSYNKCWKEIRSEFES